MSKFVSQAPVSSSHEVSAFGLRSRLANGEIDCETVVTTCLETIAATETDPEQAIRAWAWLDGEHALEQARELDAMRRRGRAIGPLHGLPVGLKDVIDTKGIPTANGCQLDEGRVPTVDAAIVSRLKAAGAVVLGKTVTTELAFMNPSQTRNPAAVGCTPGGSSSGSAVAVAAGHVPMAIGTQTAGSVIRPAAFCGVVGYKPSFGAIARTGVLTQAPSLDTIGVFATRVEDVALLADALFGFDAGDRATCPSPAPRLLEMATEHPLATPTLAMVKTPFADRADADMLAALEELGHRLAEHCFATELPDAFAQSASAQRCIQIVELSKHYARYTRDDTTGGALSGTLLGAIAEGSSIHAVDYLHALDWTTVLETELDALFERCDAILCPAAPGAAPKGMDTTGDPVFNGLWTLCGVPCITLPLLQSADGHPMGVQLVGRRGDDARLLRTARWLVAKLENEEQ